MPICIIFDRLCCMVLFASFFDVGALALKYFTVNLLHSISKASYQKSLRGVVSVGSVGSVGSMGSMEPTDF